MQRAAYLNYAKWLTVPVWAAAGIWMIMHRDQLTVQSVAAYAPVSPTLAAVCILLLYLLKTLSLTFPLKICQLAAGMLFSPVKAVLVNLAGTAVSCAAGYGMGILLGHDAADSLVRKSPRLTALLDRQRGDTLFYCFFLRSLVFLPLDAVSIWFGVSRSDFRQYMCGSLLGLLPNVIVSTLMGEQLTAPGSAGFLISCGIFLLMTLISALWYAADKRKRRQQT